MQMEGCLCKLDGLRVRDCLCLNVGQVVHVNATTWESVRSILAETKLPLISEDPGCRVVDGVLEAPRLQKWIPDSSVTRAAICTGGRYVVTGGSGALGESCVQWLLGICGSAGILASILATICCCQVEMLLYSVSITCES